MVNYFYDCYVILNKVYGDKAFIKQVINDTFIEEANRALTVKICYGVLDKDIELSYYISALTEKTPKLAVRTILKISMYMMKYLGKKDYFVVQNAVDLTKKLGKGGASGFVNAFLRNFTRVKVQFPQDETERISVQYSFPLFAVRELIEDYGVSRTERLLSAPYPDNTLCFYRTDGRNYLIDRGADFYETPFQNVFTVKNFVRDDGYDRGEYTYQALGSVAICEAVESCDSLLDCCAAPGGKSVRLSYRIGNVVAWDIHPHRVDLINDYARRMKRDNITATVHNAKSFVPEYVRAFDAVLCDAPCSGLGVAADNPDIKLNRTPENVAELVKEQTAILDAVCEYVKVNGYLYYSTCSILMRENVGAVRRFLSVHADFAIENLNSALPHENFDGANAFLPDISGGNGFFVAKLKRIK